MQALFHAQMFKMQIKIMHEKFMNARAFKEVIGPNFMTQV